MGDTTLHYACLFGHMEMVRILCKNPHIGLNIMNFGCQTPNEVVHETEQFRHC